MLKIISNFTTITALEDDIEECESLLESKDTQFLRRTLIRTVFSYFECVCSLLRQKTEAIMISQHTKGRQRLNISKISMLNDNSFRIASNGTLQREGQKQPYKNYLAFSVRSFIEESGVKTDFFSLDGWEKFQKSIELRHRLTHPRRDEEIEISTQDLKYLRKGLQWFQQTIIDTHRKATITEII